METQTFIADDKDNKEQEQLKNEWESLRKEVEIIKKRMWLDTLLSMIAWCLMLYAALKLITLEAMKMPQDNIGIYVVCSLVSIVIATITAFRGDYYYEILTLLDSYQSLHQIIQKRYAKKQEVIIDYETAVKIGRMLSNMKAGNYPFPKFINHTFFAIYLICSFIASLLILGTTSKAEKDKEQTQFTTIENKIILLDNKLTKLQAQNDSLKLEIELLKRQVKK